MSGPAPHALSQGGQIVFAQRACRFASLARRNAWATLAQHVQQPENVESVQSASCSQNLGSGWGGASAVGSGEAVGSVAAAEDAPVAEVSSCGGGADEAGSDDGLAAGPPCDEPQHTSAAASETRTSAEDPKSLMPPYIVRP